MTLALKCFGSEQPPERFRFTAVLSVCRTPRVLERTLGVIAVNRPPNYVTSISSLKAAISTEFCEDQGVVQKKVLSLAVFLRLLDSVDKETDSSGFHHRVSRFGIITYGWSVEQRSPASLAAVPSSFRSGRYRYIYIEQ